MDLPGDGISALHAAGLIPDPYFGRNEYDLRWISQADWVLSRTVMLDDPAVALELSEVDTLTTIRWNGQEVLKTANAFRSYRADLTGVAVAGENRIEITFHSAPAEADRLQAAQPFALPYSTNCPIPNGNLLRKPQCDFGWDWNIALAPFGLYGRIALVPAAAPRIDGVMVTQDHRAGAVDVTVTAHVAQAEGAPYAIAFAGQMAEGTVAGPTLTTRFTVTDPALWWPAGQGAQPLHDLSVTVGGTTASRRIGLRQIELVTERDEAGLGFRFRVNGRDIFAKGANWIPADALAGRITRDGVADLLRSAVDANMNMIRIWGGGRYEPDWFYDLCDEMGLMVWQDFMFACNIYPSDPAFLAEVEAEVAENVARLQHHACLALWCGDNELIGALTWYPETRANRDRYLVNYDRLNRAVEAALKRTDPGANWWPSSPSPGPMNFGDAWHDDGSGDMHFWSVWHEGRDFDHYRDVSPRFCSEFGFQSYPSMEVIRRFADPADWNIASPVLESHQKNAGGNARIAETMFRTFRFPARFEDFVYLSQVQQGLAIKTAVTQWRSLRPHCMGTLYWQLNDTWPVCSWASLDHGGGWKLLHHMARHFYAPVMVSAVPTGEVIELRAVNDTAQSVDLTVIARAAAMDGTVRELGRATVTVDDSATPVLTLPRDSLTSQEMLAFTWEAPDGTRGGDVFAPKPYKAYDLRAPRIELKVAQDGDGWRLTLTAEALALFVAVEADRPGRFSNNAFALFPGAPATITFTPAAPGPAPTFTLRDLHSATMTT
ncbi:MAG: glycoside hydrolase family 2 protein [Limimaricola sp.]|nr:glycoside hydrolase family 2 protein [Limimaricola sp.]